MHLLSVDQTYFDDGRKCLLGTGTFEYTLCKEGKIFFKDKPKSGRKLIYMYKLQQA